MKLWQCLVALMLAGTPNAWGVEVGEAAPDFTLAGAGGSMRLSDFRGKTVYLDFWASWCGPCKQSFPWMNEMQARYGARGLRVLAVNVDRKEADASAFLARHPARFNVVYDSAGQTPRAYAIRAMPTSLLIDPNGRVILIHSGFREDQADALEARIKAALAQPPQGR